MTRYDDYCEHHEGERDEVRSAEDERGRETRREPSEGADARTSCSALGQEIRDRAREPRERVQHQRDAERRRCAFSTSELQEHRETVPNDGYDPCERDDSRRFSERACREYRDRALQCIQREHDTPRGLPERTSHIRRTDIPAPISRRFTPWNRAQIGPNGIEPRR